MFPIDRQTLVIGALVFVATASSRLSVRSGIPFLLVFVVIGMLAGSEGIGGIDFNDFSVAHSVGSIALILILFDGGLNTSKKSIRNSWVPATVLATCGVLLTSAVVGGAAFFFARSSAALRFASGQHRRFNRRSSSVRGAPQ